MTANENSSSYENVTMEDDRPSNNGNVVKEEGKRSSSLNPEIQDSIAVLQSILEDTKSRADHLVREMNAVVKVFKSTQTKWEALKDSEAQESERLDQVEPEVNVITEPHLPPTRRASY